MTTTTDKKNTGGRPPRYNLEQVHAAITSLINGGTPRDEIDAAAVKTVLCEQYGITKGIDTRSLESPVDHVLSSLAEEEENRLIGALPETARASVESIVGAMTRELQLLVARQNAVCLAKAQEECKELRRDKTNANWRIKELETKIHDHLTYTRKSRPRKRIQNPIWNLPGQKNLLMKKTVGEAKSKRAQWIAPKTPGRTSVCRPQRTVFIHINCNTFQDGKPWKADSAGAAARNTALRASKHLGRALWRRWSRYHRRSRAETKMHYVKLLGQRLMAQDFDRQVAEFQVRVVVLNGYTALDIPATKVAG
jgi:hypothetical protein